MKYWYLLFITALIFQTFSYDCGHDQLYDQSPKQITNNFTHSRFLQSENVLGKIRIFVDYQQVKLGSRTQINTIKRAMNISANYFYNTLNVSRLQKLYYQEESNQCGKVTIPAKYGINGEGVIGDLGIISRNQVDSTFIFVAQAKICSYYKINKRPIWGMINWNNAFLKYDQRGFQEMVYTAIHQIIHILGFSADAYSKYLSGNPLFTDPNTGLHYLESPSIDREIRSHFKCSIARGLPLQDQDGSRDVSSHWQSKVLGKQLMGPAVVKHSMMSRFTLALLQSTGWYPQINYQFAAEPTLWGKSKGCSFLNINDCDSQQFCNDKALYCEKDGTGSGRCQINRYMGPCKTPKSYINLVCISQHYEYQNLNAKLNTLQRGGHLSRCFASDFRAQDKNATLLNNRCYISVCSPSGKFMFLLVGSYILVCRKPGDVITAPPGLIGTLTCPQDFDSYCKNKKTCPYHCNKNGACIDGKCLCTGETKLTPFCADVSILIEPVGDQGGLKNILQNDQGMLSIEKLNDKSTQQTSQIPKTKEVQVYDIYSRCFDGTFFDSQWGICISCLDNLNCSSCDETGCLSCDDGQEPKMNQEYKLQC